MMNFAFLLSVQASAVVNFVEKGFRPTTRLVKDGKRLGMCDTSQHLSFQE